MATNTVEATLVSRYMDGVSKGIEQTKRVLQQQLSLMGTAASALSTAISAAGHRIIESIGRMGQRYKQVGEQSDQTSKQAQSSFSAMAMSIGAAAVLIVQALGKVVVEIARQASAYTEMKITYEDLIQAQGWHAETLNRLKQASDGVISSVDLLRSANRIRQSGVRITDRMYAQLVGDVKLPGVGSAPEAEVRAAEVTGGIGTGAAVRIAGHGAASGAGADHHNIVDLGRTADVWRRRRSLGPGHGDRCSTFARRLAPGRCGPASESVIISRGCFEPVPASLPVSGFPYAMFAWRSRYEECARLAWR